MMEEAYKNYKLKHNFQINQGIEILCQEEFIHSIKTDDEFAKAWGVIVEVRELSREERYNLMPTKTGHSKGNIENRKKINNFEGNTTGVSYHEEWLDSFCIPTKAISLTYNNQTEVIYE